VLCIEPGSRRENGYVESFNGKMRNKLLDREQIDTLRQARALLEQ
jgi:putative transposase